MTTDQQGGTQKRDRHNIIQGYLRITSVVLGGLTGVISALAALLAVLLR